jgi:hypothetical protein
LTRTFVSLSHTKTLSAGDDPRAAMLLAVVLLGLGRKPHTTDRLAVRSRMRLLVVHLRLAEEHSRQKRCHA